MRRNWRTSLGGAIGVFGTTMIGAPVVWMASQSCPKWVAVAAFIGVVLSAAGRAVTAFYAADAKELERLKSCLPEMRKPATDLLGQEKGP